MRMLTLVWVLLAGCSGAPVVLDHTAAPAAKTAATTEALPPLDLSDVQTPDGDEPALSDAQLAQVWTDPGKPGEVAQTLAVAGGGVLATSVECEQPDADGPPESCAGHLTLFGADGKRTARRELFQVDGHVLPVEDFISIDALAVLDVDGDGAQEAVVRWAIVGEPAPAVGSQQDEYLEIAALPGLETLWRERVGASGAGGQESCEYTLKAQDLDRDGRRELTFRQDCMMALCRADSGLDDEDGDGIAEGSCPKGEKVTVRDLVLRANPQTRRVEPSTPPDPR